MKIPDLILEPYRLGELPKAEADRVSRLLSEDPALRERQAALDQSDDEIARAYPAGWLAQRIRARLPAPAGAGFGWRVPLAIAATVALVALVIPRWIVPPGGGVAPRGGVAPHGGVAPAPSEDRIKGLQPSLAIYRRTASGSETLADGSVARAGDQLRVAYTGAGRTYGVILSIDGRTNVTVHLPVEGDRAAPLTSGHAILLDQAYELDDAPGWERFYFVTGEKPFAVADIVNAARKADGGVRGTPAPLALSRELTQSTFTIQKEARP
jgi:hypothetical protein